ncbi:MAG: TetR/AcrR family transcriptional regulator [Betaproteobacteria bacterium]|nr:TetR/AcrR family transcriptional regulator [Betaproteobacteria bacterium]
MQIWLLDATPSHMTHAMTDRKAHAPTDEANRREALVRASARLFREKGFSATTVRDIATAVGMRSGSPFYHFANKEEILKAVMEQGLKLGLQITTDALAHAHTAVDEFRALVRTHYGILHDPGSDFIAVMIYEWKHLPQDHKREIIALKDRYDGLWHHTLSQLIEQKRLGSFSNHPLPMTDAEKTVRLMILGAINYTVTWFKASDKKNNPWTLDALIDRTVHFFLRAP